MHFSVEIRAYKSGYSEIESKLPKIKILMKWTCVLQLGKLAKCVNTG